MKYSILYLLFVLIPLKLIGQLPSFEFVLSQPQTNAFEYALETSDSNFLIAVNQFRAPSSVSKLNKSGRLVKTLMLGNDSLLVYIKRLTPTNYGF